MFLFFGGVCIWKKLFELIVLLVLDINYSFSFFWSWHDLCIFWGWLLALLWNYCNGSRQEKKVEDPEPSKCKRRSISVPLIISSISSQYGDTYPNKCLLDLIISLICVILLSLSHNLKFWCCCWHWYGRHMY